MCTWRNQKAGGRDGVWPGAGAGWAAPHSLLVAGAAVCHGALLDGWVASIWWPSRCPGELCCSLQHAPRRAKAPPTPSTGRPVYLLCVAGSCLGQDFRGAGRGAVWCGEWGRLTSGSATTMPGLHSLTDGMGDEAAPICQVGTSIAPQLGSRMSGRAGRRGVSPEDQAQFSLS